MLDCHVPGRTVTLPRVRCRTERNSNCEQAPTHWQQSLAARKGAFKGYFMSRKIKILCVMAASLALPVVAVAGDDRDSDRDHPRVYVKDGSITSQIKAQLVEQRVGSAAHIHVDTDDHGIVKLTGHVRSQDEMDAAVTIARHVEGVREVKNDMRIKRDD
jgi:hyperosmotically inducible periplasmic protein